jgi:hypothetical protein
VYLISSMDLINSLTASPDEVGAIWSLPLEYCLTAEWKEEYGVLSEKGGADWPYADEYYVSLSYTISSAAFLLINIKSRIEQLGHNVVKNVRIPNEPIPDNANASCKWLTCRRLPDHR